LDVARIYTIYSIASECKTVWGLPIEILNQRRRISLEVLAWITMKIKQQLTTVVLSASIALTGPGIVHAETGPASYYGNDSSYTAAHPSLPFGTRVRVTNMNTGQAVVVQINDRGPFTGGRVIDLSLGAARALGMLNSGVAPVSIQILGR